MDALSASEPEFVKERATPFSFVHGDRLSETGSPIEYVFFPQSGLVSLVVVLSTGEHIEAAMIGRDSALGAGVAYGAPFWVSTCVAQIAGQGLCMSAADFVTLMQRDPGLREQLYAREQYLLVQAQQMAACNARHHIPARLCSWFLRAQDVIGHGDLYVTQEFLAQLLGVQRASISLIAGALQEDGLIQYRRGRLSILNKDALAERACGCYQTLRNHQRRYFQGDDVISAG
ncbi:Crp/Fnr family transcriptional regulator [Microbacteriaceae bacterium K1510]|nr:Crp/Fnr family transcriptional regulator [Microbacteriaceae bacterium K1510]